MPDESPVVSSDDGYTAFQSANDRSRWCTVASLVEHRTYAIDNQIAVPGAPGQKNNEPWDTIDKIQHADRDGQQRFYSSKPPLLPTIVAGVYAAVRFSTGLTLTEHPLYLTRVLLALINLPLLAIFYYSTINSAKRVCEADWASRVAVFSTCFATMLLPFATTLNNHLPAAAATSLTLLIYLQSASKLKRAREVIAQWKQAPVYWFVGGASAAFAAANELPALSMLVCWLVLFLMLDRRSLFPFLWGAALVVAAFFSTNWIAHQSLRPPYAHTRTGSLIAELDSPLREPDADLTEECRMALIPSDLATFDAAMQIVPSQEDDRLIVRVNERRYALIQVEGRWQLCYWDDWYEYPGTYWSEDARQGFDRGEPSRLVYLMHITIGHHGIFALTPIWLMLPLGFLRGLAFRSREVRRLIAFIIMCSVVCLAFYVLQPEQHRNYGGVTACFPLDALVCPALVGEHSSGPGGHQ